MSTRANIMISYKDQTVHAPSELWLYHHYDGNVQGIGETVVQAVHSCGLYVEDADGLGRLWDEFPFEFENVVGLQSDIEFLYRITYANNRVTVVARHGGYAGEHAVQHYHRTNDTPDNSVQLYQALFEDKDPKYIASFGCDIREPESYLQTLIPGTQPVARAWRGRLRERRGVA
jgi:hypothetical protein